jgi:hypothetical protein
MATISMAKVLGKQADLPLHTKRLGRSPVAGLSRRTLYFLGVTVFTIQAIFLYRLFFYEPPLSVAPPYNTAETVALVTKWYELLREMRYLGHNAIAYPPHVGDKAINVTLARAMGLDERVIETMQQMPYVDDHTGGWMQERDVLFRDGRFVDYRNDRDMYLSRDPLGHWIIYDSKATDDTFEQSMMDFETLYPKSAFPLSIVRGGMWGTGDAIVLDTATNRLHIISTQGDKNRDPFFDQFAGPSVIPWEYKIKTPFYGPEIQYARSVNEALRDFIMRTAELKEEFVPGGPYLDRGYTPELCPPKWEGWIRDLYRDSAWPPGEVMEQVLFPVLNGEMDEGFMREFTDSNFETQMKELRHNITVRYMPDWYVPVPRDEAWFAELLERGDINAEQAAYARSNEEVIPFNKDGWGGRYLWSKHWEVYGPSSSLMN